MTDFAAEMLTNWNDNIRNMCAMGLMFENNNNNNNNNSNSNWKACVSGNSNDGCVD